MIEFNENTFKDFCSISKQVQAVQHKVDQEEINPELRVQLHEDLEKAQDSLEDLRGPAINTEGPASQFEEMERQIISLYRGIEEKFEETEISHISQKALDIPNLLTAGKVSILAQKVDQLKHNIEFLFAERRPSLKNRKIVQLAQKMVEHTDKTLAKGGKVSKADLQRFQLLQTLLREAIYEVELMADPECAELAMELCEVSDLFKQRKQGEAEMRLQMLRSRLSPSQLKQIDGCKNDPEKLSQLLLAFAGMDPEKSVLLDKCEGIFHTLHA